MPLLPAGNKITPIVTGEMPVAERAEMSAKRAANRMGDTGLRTGRRGSIEEEIAAASPHVQTIPLPKSAGESDSGGEDEDDSFGSALNRPLSSGLTSTGPGGGAPGRVVDLNVSTKGSSAARSAAKTASKEHHGNEGGSDGDGDGDGEDDGGNTSMVLGQSRWNRWLSVRDDEGAFVDLRELRMIHPLATSTRYWNYVVILAVAVTSVTVPMQLFFLSYGTSATMVGLLVVVDVCFLLDIAVNCRLAYFDSESDDLITDPRQVMRTYAAKWMTFDVVTGFSSAMSLIQLAFPSDMAAVDGLKGIKIIRLLRVAKIAQVWSARAGASRPLP
jgi:hypothetical protein